MQQFLRKCSFLEISTEFLFYAIIIFSVLIYGGITPFSLSVLESAIFILFFIFIAQTLSKEILVLVKFPFVPLILFLSLAVFQLFPLPPQLLNFLSPETASLYELSYSSATGWKSLSLSLGSSSETLIKVLCFFAIFLFAANFLDNKNKILRVVTVIVTLGFLLSLYGIILKLCLPGRMLSFSTFANRNHFAAYTELIIPLAISLSLVSKLQSIRIIFIFMASVMALAVFFSSSKAGIICVLIGFFVMLFTLSFKINIKKIIVAFIVLVIILLLFMIPADTDPAWIRLKTLSNPISAMGNRLILVRDSLRMARDFPVFGVGLGAFGDIFPKYYNASMGRRFLLSSNFAQNEPLQLIAEAGLLGFLFFLIFLFKLFKNSFVIWLKRKNPVTLYIGAGCCAGLISFILHSFFDFVMHVPANAVLFFIILAIFYRVARLPGQGGAEDYLNKVEVKFSKGTRKLLILILFVCLLWVEALIFKRYQAEKIFNRAGSENTSLKGIEQIFAYKKQIKELDVAISFNPLESKYYKRKADIFWRLSQLDDFMDDFKSLSLGLSKEECLALAVNLYKKAIMLSPANAGYHFQLGTLFDSLNQKDFALLEYKKSLALSPYHYKIRDFVNQYLEAYKSQIFPQPIDLY